MIDTPAIRDYIRSTDFLQPLGLPEGTMLDFSLLGRGEYNANYLFVHPFTGQKLVFRINTGSQMHLENQIGYEFDALQALSSSNRTPKAFFCDRRRGCLVMEWLPGRPLQYETDLETAAAILADIHATPVPDDHHLLRPQAPLRAIYQECLEMVEHYFRWPEADPEVCRLIGEMIDALGKLPLDSVSAASPCMVNTELNSGNFLIDPDGRSHLIDWEKPLLSEPAQDLGHFLVPTTTFWKTDIILTPADIRRFMDAYVRAAAGRFDTDEAARRLPLFFSMTCLRGITWCAMALVEYSQPGRAIVNQDTLHKIRQYVSKDFIENILQNYIYQDFLK